MKLLCSLLAILSATVFAQPSVFPSQEDLMNPQKWTANSSGAMGISFEKEGVYVMGEGPLPSVEDIARCYRLIELTAVLFTVIVVFPLCALIGVHVQIICEDSVIGLIRGF